MSQGLVGSTGPDSLKLQRWCWTVSIFPQFGDERSMLGRARRCCCCLLRGKGPTRLRGWEAAGRAVPHMVQLSWEAGNSRRDTHCPTEQLGRGTLGMRRRKCPSQGSAGAGEAPRGRMSSGHVCVPKAQRVRLGTAQARAGSGRAELVGQRDGSVQPAGTQQQLWDRAGQAVLDMAKGPGRAGSAQEKPRLGALGHGSISATKGWEETTCAEALGPPGTAPARLGTVSPLSCPQHPPTSQCPQQSPEQGAGEGQDLPSPRLRLRPWPFCCPHPAQAFAWESLRALCNPGPQFSAVMSPLRVFVSNNTQWGSLMLRVTSLFLKNFPFCFPH